MVNEEELFAFAEGFRQEVITNSQMIGSHEGSFREDEFTKICISHLVEAGDLEDGDVCYHSGLGIKVNGYHLYEDESRLDLFVSLLTQTIPPISIKPAEVEKYFLRLREFFEKAKKGYYTSLEEASCAFDMAQSIYRCREKLSRVRLFLFTDSLTNIRNKNSSTLKKAGISHHLWDIERLFACCNPGQGQEAIEIDFRTYYGEAIPCLPMLAADFEYNVCLLIIPGEVLYKIYLEYGPRLLERNVRTYLQARGSINKGIRQTILDESERFLSYNNGISATAEAAELVDLPGGGKGISKIRNFQIVNGGQTTASIYHAVRQYKADISKVYVQAKLTIIAGEQIDEVVPLISRYANSQNKVDTADFQANDPFHIKLEQLSRTVWAPTSDGTQQQTKWFYERARGQYDEAKRLSGTRAKIKAFSQANPTFQKITKTDLAKYENTWYLLPHLVSRGAQKNFVEFTLRLTGGEISIDIDTVYFKHLVAKAILFKEAEKIVQSQSFGGYRANIVTYTLAYIFYSVRRKVDLNAIWDAQALQVSFKKAIQEVSIMVYQNITTASKGRNVTEWCKKEVCWQEIKKLDIQLGAFCITPRKGAIQIETNETH